jgi:hypothetical protein
MKDILLRPARRHLPIRSFSFSDKKFLLPDHPPTRRVQVDLRRQRSTAACTHTCTCLHVVVSLHHMPASGRGILDAARCRRAQIPSADKLVATTSTGCCRIIVCFISFYTRPRKIKTGSHHCVSFDLSIPIYYFLFNYAN